MGPRTSVVVLLVSVFVGTGLLALLLEPSPHGDERITRHLMRAYERIPDARLDVRDLSDEKFDCAYVFPPGADPQGMASTLGRLANVDKLPPRRVASGEVAVVFVAGRSIEEVVLVPRQPVDLGHLVPLAPCQLAPGTSLLLERVGGGEDGFALAASLRSKPLPTPVWAGR